MRDEAACPHETWQRDYAAVEDGMCPLCLAAALAEARRALDQWEEAEEQRAGDYCERCDAGEPHRMRWGKYGEYVSHAPDSHTAGMGCHQGRQHRLTALYEALRAVEARDSEARRIVEHVAAMDCGRYAPQSTCVTEESGNLCLTCEARATLGRPAPDGETR